MAAALVIFVLAVSEFGVPGVLRVRVYTTEIFTAFAALYDPGRAALLALPLLALCLAVAVVAVALIGDRFVSARRGADTPGALRVKRSRSLLAMVTMVSRHGTGPADRRARAGGPEQPIDRWRDRRVW